MVSTKWRLEKGIIGWAVRLPEKVIIETLSNMDLSQLQTLHLFGGEPMLGPTTKTILKCLVNQLPSLTVWVDTNATTLPDTELMDMLQQCKKIYWKESNN